MNRLLLGAALAAVVAVPLSARFGRGPLYEGKVIRLPDGRRYELLSRDRRAEGYWHVRVGRTAPGDEPIVVSLDADDLYAAQAGDYPPFPDHPPTPEPSGR